jgi:hypothetical protein
VIIPGMFQASGDDGSWLVNAWTQQAANQATARAERLEDENRRLRQQVSVVEKPREPSLGELGFAAGWAGLNLLATMATKPAAFPAPEKPKSLLQLAREERAVKLAEAEAKGQNDFRQSVREQMEQFPPEEYPQLYSHLEPEDWPMEYLDVDNEDDEPTEDEDMVYDTDDDTDDAASAAPAAPAAATAPAPKPRKKAVAAPKPNGDAEPDATEDTGKPMSDATQWALIGGVVACIALAWKFAPR